MSKISKKESSRVNQETYNTWRKNKRKKLRKAFDVSFYSSEYVKKCFEEIIYV